VTSAGMGCMAALDAENWLAEHDDAGQPDPDHAWREDEMAG
jgi:thioredoxin reductase (NADPH)